MSQLTKLIAAAGILALLPTSCLNLACNSPKANSMAEFKEQLNTLSDFARQNDAVVVVTANLSDDIGLYGKQEFGLHSGINAQATVILNSSDEEVPEWVLNPDGSKTKIKADPSIPAGVVGTGGQ